MKLTRKKTEKEKISNGELKTIQIVVPDETHKKLAIQAVKADLTLRRYCSQLLEKQANK